LSERTDLIITNADKGGAVVVMDTDRYITEANRQLSNTENYKQIKNNPTFTNNKLINDTIERFKNSNELKSNIAEGLKTLDAKTPKLYFLPKIHKKRQPW